MGLQGILSTRRDNLTGIVMVGLTVVTASAKGDASFKETDAPIVLELFRREEVTRQLKFAKVFRQD